MQCTAYFIKHRAPVVSWCSGRTVGCMSSRIPELLKRAYRSFRSARMTIVILSVLLGLYFLGLIIPQRELMPSTEAYAAWKTAYPNLTAVIEYLQLNDIYVAPITVFFLCLFFLNLIVVIAQRLPVVLKRMYLQQGSEETVTAVRVSRETITVTTAANVDASGQKIRNFLKKRLWSIIGGDGSTTFAAVRNRYSPIGFLFFHASFFLCLVGGLLVVYTRFSGTFILAEGQEFTPDVKNFRRITRDPKMLKELHPFNLRLDRVAPRYDRDVSSDLDIDVTMSYDGREEKQRLRVNEPIRKGPLSILSQSLGFSPLMVLRTEDGRELSGSYFLLNVLNGNEDSFEFSGMPYQFTVRLFPDFIMRDGQPATRSKDLNDPVMELKVNRNGVRVFEGLLPLKQEVSFNGLRLSFADLRQWVEFYIVREYGTYVLYSGFLLGVLGLVLRLLFYQKRIWITLTQGAEGTTVMISGTSEYYTHLFRDELETFAQTLQTVLAAEEPQRTVTVPSTGKGTDHESV